MTNQPTPAALVFDMDGTLIDNMPIHIQVWTQYLAELGAQAAPGAFHDQTAGKTNTEILRMFLGDDLPEERLAAYSREKEQRYRRLYRSALAPLPGLLPFLERARAAGLALALATSAGRENIDFTLQLLGISGVFSVIVGAEQVQRGKPDPQAFLLAAAGLGLPPERCLAFEDSLKGIAAAHAAGMPVIALLTGMSAGRALALPGVRAAYPDYAAMNGIY